MKRYGLLIVLFSTAILFFASSCGRDVDESGKDDEMTYENRDEGMGDQTVIEDKNQFWTTDRDYTFEQRSEFRNDVNAAIERLDNKINDLEQHSANATGDTKEWYKDRIAELKDHRSEIQEDLQDFAKITADNWDSFKSGITSTWNDIEDSYSEMARDDRMMDDQRY